MKNIISLFAFLSMVFVGCTTIPEGVSTETDSFTGNQKTFATMYLNNQSKTLGDMIALVLTVARNGDYYYAYTKSTSVGWFFFEAVGIKIDDTQPQLFQATKFNRDVLNGRYVEETVFYDIPLSMIEAMAEAETVQLRLMGSRGNYDDALQPKHFDILDEFLAEVKN